MQKDFTRIAIVNRGEPVMRFIHAVQEYNRENGTALRAIALYTEPDRRAMFVREADEAVNLGAATYIDPRDGQRKNSYLDYARLERALIESRAEAVWVGWGFLDIDPMRAVIYTDHSDFFMVQPFYGNDLKGRLPDNIKHFGEYTSKEKQSAWSPPLS